MAKKLKKKIKKYPKIKSRVTIDVEAHSFVDFSEALREVISEEKSKHRIVHGSPDLDFFSKKKSDTLIDYSQAESRTLRSLSKKPPIVTDLEGTSIDVTEIGVPSVSHNEMEVGSRVNLISDRYIGTIPNPSIGSVYECEGTVIKLFNEDACSVRWDNGRINEYNITKDLVFVTGVSKKTPSKNSLKTNDRVRLTVLTKYTPSYDNPVVTSKYECEGIVTYGGSQTSLCDVLWDNGEGNSYSASDLSLANSELKSCKSIW